MTTRPSAPARLALPLAKHATLAPERLAADFAACADHDARVALWRGICGALRPVLRQRGLTGAEIEAGLLGLADAVRPISRKLIADREICAA